MCNTTRPGVAEESYRLGLADERSLEGVVRASNASTAAFQVARGCLVGQELYGNLNRRLQSLPEIEGDYAKETKHITRLAVAVSFARARSNPHDLTFVDLEAFWTVLRDALMDPGKLEFKAGRSHQGFISVPFCELQQANGDNDELWRLHVWLPNRPQPNSEVSIHSHQSFAQSWILAGHGVNTDYNAREVQGSSTATHAVFALTDRTPVGDRESMTIKNTGKSVEVTGSTSEMHSRDMSYTVPAGAFHTSQVPQDLVHATIFCFDASRGFSWDGGVSLGPLYQEQYVQYRCTDGAKPANLARIVEAQRCSESGQGDGM